LKKRSKKLLLLQALTPGLPLIAAAGAINGNPG
jgi:hypothetical protein